MDVGLVPAVLTDSTIRLQGLTTSSALRIISDHGDRQGKFADWYESGRDFCYYAAAQEACRLLKERLKTLALSDRELVDLFSCKNVETSVEEIRRVGGQHTAVGNFVNTFCDVALQVSGVVQLFLPQSPEYTVTYGAIVIIFKAVVAKRKQQEALSQHLEALRSTLPLVEFYQDVFPTNKIKLTAAQLYVQVLSFLEEAVVYSRSGRLSKLVDAVLQGGDDRFAARVGKITTETTKLRELKDASHIAQQSDMKELLTSTGHVVARLYESMEGFSTAVSSSMQLLATRCDAIEAQTATMYRAQASTHAQTLADILLPDGDEPADDLQSLRARPFRLSPKDHWEVNGILPHLLSWSQSHPQPLLWVGGACGNRDSWVTPFALDFVTALEQQRVPVLHVFCDLPPPTTTTLAREGGLRIDTLDDGVSRPVDPARTTTTTPALVLRKLLYLLITRHPTLAFARGAELSARKCRQARTPEQLGPMLEGLLTELSATAATPVFVLVDRVEQCEDAAAGLLPWLERLAVATASPGATERRVGVIVTSIYEPPEERGMKTVFIDTGKSGRHRK